MRLTLALSIVIYLIPYSSYSQFRNTEWGWPPILVKQSEENKNPKIDYSGNVITSLYYFDEKIGIYDVAIMYKFEKGLLVYGTYHIIDELYDTITHIDTFRDLKMNLNVKYGDPIQDDHKTWKKPADKYIPRQNDFLELMSGNLEYSLQWLVEDHTYISLLLSKSSYDELQTTLMYIDAKKVGNKEIVKPYEGL